jgi:hypothetical protein
VGCSADVVRPVCVITRASDSTNRLARTKYGPCRWWPERGRRPPGDRRSLRPAKTRLKIAVDFAKPAPIASADCVISAAAGMCEAACGPPHTTTLATASPNALVGKARAPMSAAA